MTQWTLPEAVPRGSVVVIPGRGEGPGVYERLARRLVFDGYRVAITEGQDPREALGTSVPGIPIVIIGSDTGALAALRAAQDPRVDGIVLAGLIAGEAGAPTDWDGEVRARSACPLHAAVMEHGIRRGTLSEKAQRATRNDLAGLRVPALAVHGADDVISPMGAVLPLLEAAPEIETVVVAGGLHDVLNDVAHRSVAAAIVQFLERLRIPGGGPILHRAGRNLVAAAA
jgi:alpha-beta hydrolase superfamily lysophospholipase